jgi:hypothetical protein
MTPILSHGKPSLLFDDGTLKEFGSIYELRDYLDALEQAGYVSW